jgi:hypothetical protein
MLYIYVCFIIQPLNNLFSCTTLMYLFLQRMYAVLCVRCDLNLSVENRLILVFNTAPAWVRSEASPYGIFGRKCGTGTGSFKVCRTSSVTIVAPMLHRQCHLNITLTRTLELNLVTFQQVFFLIFGQQRSENSFHITDFKDYKYTIKCRAVVTK